MEGKTFVLYLTQPEISHIQGVRLPIAQSFQNENQHRLFGKYLRNYNSKTYTF